jgi:hypothetical protein
VGGHTHLSPVLFGQSPVDAQKGKGEGKEVQWPNFAAMRQNDGDGRSGRLNLILQKLCNNTYNIFICGDVNVNYLMNNNQRSQLDAVLHSYNLMGVEFPTRFGLNSQTDIDSVFIDISTIGNYELYPLINGLSDHDAQMLILNKGQKKGKGMLYLH